MGCSVEGQLPSPPVLLIEIGLGRHLKIPQGLKHLAVKANRDFDLSSSNGDGHFGNGDDLV